MPVAPFRESDVPPNVPLAPFYNAQLEIAKKLSAKHGFSWTVTLPLAVFGATRQTAMTLATSLAVYIVRFFCNRFNQQQSVTSPILVNLEAPRSPHDLPRKRAPLVFSPRRHFRGPPRRTQRLGLSSTPMREPDPECA